MAPIQKPQPPPSRPNTVSVRLTDAEYARLKALCKQWKLQVSIVARDLLMQAITIAEAQADD